jgi:hypothetical protein
VQAEINATALTAIQTRRRRDAAPISKRSPAWIGAHFGRLIPAQNCSFRFRILLATATAVVAESCGFCEGAVQ